jgi:hypothetical protein
LEEWDDFHMPLLNKTSIEGWLENKTTSTVLFFDRANKKNMQMHALYSSVAHMLTVRSEFWEAAWFWQTQSRSKIGS